MILKTTRYVMCSHYVSGQAFESPDTLQSCVSFLRQYAVDSSSKAACLVVAKKTIAFPQVWNSDATA